MKKPAFNILVLVTSIFASFAAGFFLGRHLNRAPVRIYQPSVQTAQDSAPAESESHVMEPDPAVTEPEPTGPVMVNINTASAQELEALPGIGPVLAERIIAYRSENGGFRAPEELAKVKGIGESKLEDILDLITTGG